MATKRLSKLNVLYNLQSMKCENDKLTNILRQYGKTQNDEEEKSFDDAYSVFSFDSEMIPLHKEDEIPIEKQI